MTVSEPTPAKPLLRGVLHHVAFFLALAVAPFVVLAADGTRARVSVGVFAAAVAALGSSAPITA